MGAGGRGYTGIRASDLFFRFSTTQGGNKILGKLIAKHIFFFFFCKKIQRDSHGGYGEVCVASAEEYIRSIHNKNT